MVRVEIGFFDVLSFMAARHFWRFLAGSLQLSLWLARGIPRNSKPRAWCDQKSWDDVHAHSFTSQDRDL